MYAGFSFNTGEVEAFFQKFEIELRSRTSRRADQLKALPFGLGIR